MDSKSWPEKILFEAICIQKANSHMECTILVVLPQHTKDGE